ncbi:MAG: HEAT repeat domain-containing protein [Planctomycetes bacterium]|nr:HEAT repeat domain-containing protein [Planctomycetota bacterium]
MLLGLIWTAPAQGPGGQHEAYFPPPSSPSHVPNRGREFTNILRQLRKGSGPDRLEVRSELMGRVDYYLAEMLPELKAGKGNHFVQRQVCLVLMQVGDDRASRALQDLVLGGKRGARGLAGLALGRLHDPSAVKALRHLMDDSDPRSKLMAYLALGRIGGAAATKILLKRLRDGPPTREREALALALGLTGSADVGVPLRRLLRQNKDGLRRAAAIAAGYLAQDLAAPLLIPRAVRRTEEDKQVRVIALRGIARMSADPDAFAALSKWRPEQISDADEEAAWVFALAALGGERVLGSLKQWWETSPREEVRSACAAATILVGGRKAGELAAFMQKDNKDRVVRASLLATVAHAQRNGEAPAFMVWSTNSDEKIRRIALCGDVYRYGEGARKRLELYLDPEFKDDVRKLALQLLKELDGDEAATRRICRARLQRLLDEEGLAPSWNLNLSANKHIYRVLDLENAIIRRGAGLSGNPDRGTGAAALSPTQEEEDLRRHLDRFPYLDLRRAVEMPDTWTSSF